MRKELKCKHCTIRYPRVCCRYVVPDTVCTEWKNEGAYFVCDVSAFIHRPDSDYELPHPVFSGFFSRKA